MKKTYIRRLLSAAMCIIMVLALLGGCAAPSESPDDGHDHEHEDVNTAEPGNVENLSDEEVPLSGTYCAGDHNFKVVRSVSEGRDCEMGSVNYQVYQCTKCGLEYYTAIRSNGKKDGGGTHDWQEQQLPGGCSGNPGILKTCKTCGMKIYTGGGAHTWGEWKAPEGKVACTETYQETRTCSKCSTTETREHNPVGHSWSVKSETPATCTEAKTIVRTCNRCGETETQVVGTPLGHNFGGGNTDCTAERECTRCHIKVPGGTHTYTLYVQDGDRGHYLLCAVCRMKDTTLYKHYDQGDGFCVCGYQLVSGATPGQCNHDWQFLPRNPEDAGHTGKNGAFSHWEKCSKCGETRSASCSNYPSARQYCTDDVFCTVCGNKVADGQKNHNLSGGWEKTADGHTISCKNSDCQYKVEEPHTFNGTSTDCTVPNKCTVCGYASGTAASKQHNWSDWYDGGNGTHIRKCQNANCTVTESAMHTVVGSTDDCTRDMVCSVCNAIVVEGSAQHVWGYPVSAGEGGHNAHCLHPGCSAVQNSGHSGGTATCTSPAQCAECGGFYGAKNPNNHAGGTEIRDAVAATVGKEGYTGDVYCKGCGVKLSSGEKIPALKEDHVHAYSSAWSTDADNHWHDCECGDKNSLSAHTFKDGKCTVCGMADPNYVVHVHSYTETWSADSHYHWHVCTGCGRKEDVSAHVIVTTDDGTTHCLTCGMTLAAYEEKVEEEEAAHDVTRVFNDVKADSYYTESIQRLYDLKLMNGKGASFDVEGAATRKEFMTVVARLNNVEGSTGPTWDTSSVNWCVENGYAERGDVNALITRQEIVTILWKLADKPEVEYDLSSFTDSGDLKGEALQAMKWAVSVCIMTGRGSSLALNDTAKRCEIATFIVRYLDKVVNA